MEFLEHIDERIESCALDGEHEFDERIEDRRLLAGERRVEAREQIFERLERAGFNLLLDVPGIGLHSLAGGGEHIECGGLVILGVYDDKAIRHRPPRREEGETFYVGEQRPRVEDDDRRRIGLFDEVEIRD